MTNIASRVDFCNAILAGSPRSMTDKLQRLMNAAARLVTGTHKFVHGLSRLLHDDLHWLDVPERIQYKIGVTVHCSLQSKAPKYLTDGLLRSSLRYCQPTPSTLDQLTSPICTTLPAQYLQRRAFSVTGPTVWNSLSGSLRDPAVNGSNFRRLLETTLFIITIIKCTD